MNSPYFSAFDYRGADKSLARPGRKQANVFVRMAWISFVALPCRKKKTWWQFASRCCWNRARPSNASEIVSFLVGLRTYQQPGIRYLASNEAEIKITKVVNSDSAKSLLQGDFHFRNAAIFHGTRVNVISFASHNGRRNLLAPIGKKKLTNTQQNNMLICWYADNLCLIVTTYDL